MKNLKTRARIMVLVILVALPALLLTFYGAIERRTAAELQARAEIRRLARLAALQQKQLVDGARQMMAASSLVLSDLQKDRRRCTEYFAGLLRQNRDVYHSMGLFKASGELLCNAVSWHDRTFGGDRLYFRLARETGKFSIGDYQIGRITSKAGINLGYPIFGPDGKVGTVAFAGLDLDSLGRIAEATPLPPDAILSVVDVKGTIVARKPAMSERIGEKLWNPQLIDSLLAGREGVFEAKDGDGVSWLFTHEVVAQNPDGAFPLRVIIAVPLERVFADANRALVRGLLGIILVTLFLLVGGWYGAEWFVLRKIRAIVGAAERMRSGELSARTGISYGKEELGALARAFDDMAQVLEQRERALQQQAITDPLTGLYNRRHFAELLPREIMRARRSGSAVAVILMDLDYFKRVNDTFGHEAGDLTLCEIGALLRANVRGSDIACRYGGEEFALVLPQADAEAALRRTEGLRSQIGTLRLTHQGKSLWKLTASFGIALFPDNAGDMDSLLRAADEALYQAKGAGRDCVVVSSAKET